MESISIVDVRQDEIKEDDEKENEIKEDNEKDDEIKEDNEKDDEIKKDNEIKKDVLKEDVLKPRIILKKHIPMSQRTDLVECPRCHKMLTERGLKHAHKCKFDRHLTAEQKELEKFNESSRKASNIIEKISDKINNEHKIKLKQKQQIDKEELNKLVDEEIERRTNEKRLQKQQIKKEAIKKLTYNII